MSMSQAEIAKTTKIGPGARARSSTPESRLKEQLKEFESFQEMADTGLSYPFPNSLKDVEDSVWSMRKYSIFQNKQVVGVLVIVVNYNTTSVVYHCLHEPQLSFSNIVSEVDKTAVALDKWLKFVAKRTLEWQERTKKLEFKQ